MKIKLGLSLLLGTAALISCSKSGGGAGPSQSRNTEQLETEMYGTYIGILAPINKKVSGHLNGTVSLIREHEDLTVDVKVSNGPVSVAHNQSIHIGSRCPTDSDDLNGDGYIDAEEGIKVYQEIIIPLDSDISAQHIGLGENPASDEYGNYLWSRSAPYIKIVDDLREEDINPKDDYVRLPPDKSLTMLGKVAVIMGVPATTVLPETVAGRGRLSPHQGLPVACAVLRRIALPPGQVDTDETGIPVPEGETIGGSSGADDGAIFTEVNPGGDYGSDEEEIPTVTNETEHGNTTSSVPR